MVNIVFLGLNNVCPLFNVSRNGVRCRQVLLVAGLCRWAKNRGIKVQPFKPQNMSNNAAVAAGNGEVGRAQALQAKACGIQPLI